MKRYNLCVPKPTNSDRPFWLKIGTMFESSDGKISIKLDSIPVGDVVTPKGDVRAWDGWVKVFEDNDRNDRNQPRNDSRSNNREGGKTDLDDEIPF